MDGIYRTTHHMNVGRPQTGLQINNTLFLSAIRRGAEKKNCFEGRRWDVGMAAAIE